MQLELLFIISILLVLHFLITIVNSESLNSKSILTQCF